MLEKTLKEYRKAIRGRKNEWMFIKLQVTEDYSVQIKQFENHIQILECPELNTGMGGVFKDTQKECVEYVKTMIKHILEVANEKRKDI